MVHQPNSNIIDKIKIDRYMQLSMAGEYILINVLKYNMCDVNSVCLQLFYYISCKYAV